MKRVMLAALVVTMLAAFAGSGAQASGALRAGFGVRTITPVGASPAGWDFVPGPRGIWGEPFTDSNGNGYYDPGEPFTDDLRNSQIDPQSTGEWDGCWTNAGFSGKGALGVHDDVWARAVVVEAGDTKVALVSLDVVGFFYEEVQRVRAELNAAHPGNGVDEVIISSTHTHEACDTMGFWGNPPYASDGKFPLYQAYIRSRIVEAVAEANTELTPARLKVATGTNDIGIRDSRPPQVIDPLVPAAQFLTPGGDVIGTLVNWSNHPEALGSGNRYISSDFPHGTRTKLEAVTGAPAIYFSGSVGGLMTPLGKPIPGWPTDDKSVARTYKIGEYVADAALAALSTAPIEDPTSLDLKSKEVFMDADNQTLGALNRIGIFDKPTFIDGIFAERAGDQFKTQIVSLGLGSARFQTVPGELFPELELGGYGRADCPQADTGRPYEPTIRSSWDETHLFTLGLAQDELGYIVPGYDFWADGPDDQAGGTNVPRPIVSGFGELAGSADPCGEEHYEESVSASSIMAPYVTCTIAELAGKNPWADLENYPACSSENTTVGPQGLHPEALTP